MADDSVDPIDLARLLQTTDPAKGHLRNLPDPRDFGLLLPHTSSVARDQGEIRNLPDRPDAYLESRINEAPITPGQFALPMARIPGLVIGGATALSKANESWPLLSEAAGEVKSDLADLLQKGIAPPAEAGGLPHERWYTPNGQLKIGPEAPKEEIRTLQSFLKATGRYTGPIDGKWETGTAKAAGGYGDMLQGQAQQEASRVSADAAARKADADAQTAAANAKLAEADKAKTDLQAQEDAKKEADAKAFGDFSEQYRSDHPIATFPKEHPALSAVGVGIPSYLAALLMERGLAGKFNTAEQNLASDARSAVRRAGRADISTGAGRGERATELNWVWDKGQSDELPFLRKGRAWAHNPNAPDASQLSYEPSFGTRLQREGTSAALTGGIEGAIELTAGSANLDHYEKELVRANAELAKGYTPERAKDVLDAENNIATFQAIQRGAFGAFGGGVTGAAKGAFMPPDQLKTSPGAAERYREELAEKIAAARKRKKP